MKNRSALVISLLMAIIWQLAYTQDLSRLKRVVANGFGQEVETRMNSATGTAYMINVDEAELRKRALDQVLDPLDSLRNFLQRTPQLGIINTDEELELMAKMNDFQIPGLFQWSFQQVYKGLKVYGSALRVTFNEHHDVVSVTSTIVPELHLDVVPTLTQDTAASIARSSLNSNMTYDASQIELVVYRTSLTQGKAGTNHVAYHVITICTEHLDVHHIFVDAHTSAVIDSFTGVHNALSRYVTNYGSKKWIYTEGQGTTGNIEIDTLVTISGQLYTVMQNVGGYDSWDLRGAPFKMYTNTRSGALSGWQCPNAAFVGQYGASFYCPGLGNGIDVVAHEWGHGYISGLADLQYQYQSGALNEGYADIIGESIQLFMNQPVAFAPRTSRSCSLPNDNRRWVIGDQVSNVLSSRNSAGQYIGIRDMYNPNCYGDPASVDDNYMWCSSTDNGGVHTNSGIPNQAYALFVDGGTLNGQSVVGVGLIKAFHIYVRGLSKHVPTSTFAQHASFLIKACQELSNNNVNLRDPLSGDLSGQVVTSSNCAILVQVLSATGLASGKFCGSQAPVTPLPVFTPTAAPVTPPVPAPIRVPVSPPVHAPVPTPVSAPVSVPVSAPVRAPASTPTSSPTSIPGRTPQVLRGPFPAIVPQDGGYVFWNTKGFNTGTDDVWCHIDGLHPYKGQLTVNQWTEFAVCSTPHFDSTQSFNISVSSDGVVYNSPSTVRVYANTVRVLEVTPAAGSLEGGNEITIKGSGFAQFTGCNPEITYATSPDCLVCIFGDNERIMAATLIDSNTVSCTVPSWYSLAADNTTVQVYVSVNYWNLIGPLAYQFTGEITPYISALPPVRVKPVQQGSVVSATIISTTPAALTATVAVLLYIL